MRHLLLRRFEDGELDTRRAKGEGLVGGPPTTRNSDGSDSASASPGRPPLDEARELRLSLGGGMGDGDDMAAGGGATMRGRSEEVEVEVQRPRAARASVISGQAGMEACSGLADGTGACGDAALYRAET